MATTTAPPRAGRHTPNAGQGQSAQRSRPAARKQRNAAHKKPGVASRSHETSKATPAPKKAKKLTKAAKSTAVAVSNGGPGPSQVGRKLALKAVKTVARRALESGVETVQRAAELTTKSGHGALGAIHRQVPIQRSLDVAVPLGVAWDEWMTFPWLPEGAHHVQDIERDGDDRLSGRIADSSDSDWEAEILDERDRESFAWMSVKGSDCAGLITFHRLGERLTRLELNLDVVPTSVPEALALSTHLADHRAEADLRRFKARCELINPDLYENDQEQERASNRDSDDDE